MATARKKPAAKAPARTAPIARAAKAAAKKPKKAEPKAAAPKAEDKPKKPKLVRDSFTIPKLEYGVIEILKQRAARLGRPAKKSEVLRAGVKALESMPDEAFLACITRVPSIKTGRPAKA